MKKAFILMTLIALTASFVFANGGSDDATAAPPMVDVVEEGAMAYFAEIEGSNIIPEADFIEKVKAGDDMFIIDIRRADDYAAGHVIGAVNVPWGPAIAENLAALPQSGEIYLYCYSGQTAGQAVAVLNVAGVPVKSVRYGFSRGIATVEGFEEVVDTVSVALPAAGASIDPAMQAAVDAYFNNLGDAPFKNNIVSADDLSAILAAGDDSVQVVSVRRGEDYAAGHIEGAMNLPWGNGMQAGFADLPADKKLVVYCYSGQTAGQTVGILNLLGYDAVSLNSGMGTGKTGAAGWVNAGNPVVQ